MCHLSSFIRRFRTQYSTQHLRWPSFLVEITTFEDHSGGAGTIATSFNIFSISFKMIVLWFRYCLLSFIHTGSSLFNSKLCLLEQYASLRSWRDSVTNALLRNILSNLHQIFLGGWNISVSIFASDPGLTHSYLESTSLVVCEWRHSMYGRRNLFGKSNWYPKSS